MNRTLIETVRVIAGRAPLWSLHIDRLTRSCQDLGMSLPDLVEPRGGEDRVVRFEIRAGEVQVTPRGVGSLAPIVLAISPAVHRGYRHKTANRAWLDAARASALAGGADDALLLTEEGGIVEATRWALGWWEEEVLCFPPLALGGLPSVARARLGEVSRGGIISAELSRSALRTKSLLACNAARGVVPVHRVDDLPIGPNHRTLALQSRFWFRPSA
jgi:branched-subunit amino acid aminotransferase/4-amino-4-deoxychorismate lyase